MVAEGSDLALNCTTSGHPTPATYWLRDGQVLEEGPGLLVHRLPRSSLLVVRSVNTTDGGTYNCFSNNSVGSDTERVTVTVLVRPSLSTVPPNITARAGETVDGPVVCEANGVPPPVVVILDPQGGIVGESGVWTPPTPLTRDIGGTYQCTATNQVGQVSVSFTFSVEGECRTSEGGAEWSGGDTVPSLAQPHPSSPHPRTLPSLLVKRLSCTVRPRALPHRWWPGAGWTTRRCPPTMTSSGVPSGCTASPWRTPAGTSASPPTHLGQMRLSPGSVWWVSLGWSWKGKTISPCVSLSTLVVFHQPLPHGSLLPVDPTKAAVASSLELHVVPPVLVCLPRVPLQRGQQWRSSRLRCLW